MQEDTLSDRLCEEEHAFIATQRSASPHTHSHALTHPQVLHRDHRRVLLSLAASEKVLDGSSSSTQPRPQHHQLAQAFV